MNIGFDLDGVLNNIENFQLEFGAKFFKGKHEIINPDGYGIKEVFGCTDEEEIEFWTKYTLKFFLKPAREGISDVIKKLCSHGNKIFIISSRALTTKNTIKGKIMRILVEKWLERNHIDYEDITYCSVENSDVDKSVACKKYGIEVMVEDKRENIKTLSKITKVICMNTKNNDGLVDNNIICVNNAQELYKEIRTIQIQKNSFKLLSRKERSTLSNSELIEYYKDLRNYYCNLPYDEVKSDRDKKHCRLVAKLLLAVFNTVYNPQILNKDRLKLFNQNGGVILASNHLHALDPLLIIKLMNEKAFRLLAKSELLDQKIGRFFEYIGSVFVNRDESLSRKEASEELIRTLLHGGNIMQFPEGTRNFKESGRYMLDFEYGTVDIAQKTGVPIFPFAVNDNYKFRGNNLFVNIGEPMYVKPNDDLTEANNKLREIIGTLFWEIIEQSSLNNNLKKDRIKKHEDDRKDYQLFIKDLTFNKKTSIK